jgi:hypothetical protein
MLTRIEVTDREQEAAEREAQESALGLIVEAYKHIESAIGSLTEASGRMKNATETFSGLKGTEGKVNRAVRYLTGLQGSLYQEHRTFKLGNQHTPELIGSSNLVAYERAKGHYRKALRLANQNQSQSAGQAMGQAIKQLVSMPPGSLSTMDQLKRANKYIMDQLRRGNAEMAASGIEDAIAALKRGTVSLR